MGNMTWTLMFVIMSPWIGLGIGTTATLRTVTPLRTVTGSTSVSLTLRRSIVSPGCATSAARLKVAKGSVKVP